MALLEIENLHVSYGSVEVLHGISLHVDEGEIVTLLGANGAGKSTTLLSISRLVNPREGRITFDGKNLLDYESYQVVGLGVAQSPEGRRVFGTMTVQENLMLGAFQVHSETIKQNTLEWIFQLFPRLLERRSQMAGTLSGGEQQMLAMGRALMSNPKLLMLDEPSMGLAPILVEQIFDIIEKLNEAGTTILLVEQNAQAALAIADKAYVLETGKIILSGTGAELARSEQVKKAYLGG